MTTYVLRNGELVERQFAEPLARGPMIQSDLAAFKSPLEGHKIIEGRAQLRDELKRNNCRIVEPSEWLKGKPGYSNPKFAHKRGLQVTVDRIKPQGFGER